MVAVSDLLLLNTRMVVISPCFVPSSNSPQSLGFLLLNLKRQTAITGTPSVLCVTHTHTHTHTGGRCGEWTPANKMMCTESIMTVRMTDISAASLDNVKNKSRTTGRIRILPVEYWPDCEISFDYRHREESILTGCGPTLGLSSRKLSGGILKLTADFHVMHC